MNIELFTAAEVAAALGKSRFAVRRALAHVPRTGIRPDCGNADAWSITALPETLRAELRAVHERVKIIAGYRTLADVLRNPPDRWQPLLPLAQCAPADVRHAEALQRAFSAALALPKDATDTDRARRAADDYRRECGHTVSERHLRALIRRTLDRDGGAQDFHRLELYLADSPRRADSAPAAGTSPAAFDFATLQDAFSACENRTAPTIADRDWCWDAVVRFWSDAADRNEAARPLRVALLCFLDRALPRLGKTRAAIERTFERKIKNGARPDQRPTNSGRAEPLVTRFPAEIEKLKVEVKALHGDISQAFRNLMCGTARSRVQFSDEFKSAVEYDSLQRKSYVPGGIRRAMRCYWNAVEPFVHGPRAVQMAAPNFRLDHSNERAGDCYTGDDFTFNHPLYVPDDKGEFEAPAGWRFNWTRAQVLIFTDAKSSKILAYNAIPERSYNASHVHQGLYKMCLNQAIGLPFKRFHIERSVWAGEVVTGMVRWPAIADVLKRRENPIQLIQATKPTGKPRIESVGGRLQSIMEAAPFYVGRNERDNPFEREQDFIGKLKRVGQPIKEAVDPSRMMMSWEEFLAELDRCIEVYNNEPQGGDLMRGGTGQNRSPEKVWSDDAGSRAHEVLPPSLAYLLSTSVSDQTVQRRGVRAPGSEIWYSDSARLGELIGEKVRVRFNPDLPEIVIVCHLASDPNGRKPFAVGVGPIATASGGTSEEFARGRAIQKRFQSFGRAQFKAFPPKHNLTIQREELGTADDRASGVAHHEIMNGEREVKSVQRRHAGEVRELAQRHNLGIDLGKDRDPAQTVEYLREISEIEQRIIDQEAADDGEAVSQVKPYKLPLPAGAGASRKQREASYWKARNELEASLGKPAVIAITRKTLGAIVAAPQLSDEQLAKMTSVFAAILRDRAAATL